MNKITLQNFDKVISKIKCDLLLNQQFFGLILSKINVILLDQDDDHALAYTDGKSICFYRNHIEDCTIENIKFVLCHEIMHLLLNHLIRRNDKHPIIWNFATDYIVNYLLKHNKKLVGTTYKDDPIGEMPTHCLYDSKYNENWNAESIYNDLLENGGSSDGKLQISSLIIQDNRDIKTDYHPQSAGDKGEVSDRNSKEFIIDICSNLNKICSKSEIPSCISRLFEKFSNINYNWKAILYSYVKTLLSQSTSTWKKPSRRSVSLDTYLPNINKTKHFKCNIAIDTSGSMDYDDINDVISNIYSMCNQMQSFTMNIFTFSGICHTDSLITITEKDTNKLQKLELKSNWSTNIKAAFQFVEDNKQLKDSDVFICMTDGYDNIENLVYKKPLIWCICNNNNFINPSKCYNSKIVHIPRRK
jgi:predicted metal-dependent peptidase